MALGTGQLVLGLALFKIRIALSVLSNSERRQRSENSVLFKIQNPGRSTTGTKEGLQALAALFGQHTPKPVNPVIVLGGIQKRSG